MNLIPDLIQARVVAGAKALVVSDLHLAGVQDSSCMWASDELSECIEEWDGPGVVVLAGDTFEMLSAGEGPAQALAAYPRLTKAFRSFGLNGDARRLVCLAGNHDGQLAWDQTATAQVVAGLGAEIALAVDLLVETAGGTRKVRVEHGHRLDPFNAFKDPHSSNDTPVGHHLSRDLLPALKGPAGAWLEGAQNLANPQSFPTFMASRLIYRRMVKHLWWVGLPFAVALALKLPVLYALLAPSGHAAGLGTWSQRLMIAGLAAVADLTLIGGALFLSARRVWMTIGSALGPRGPSQNGAARTEAETLLGEGYSGLVTGHTHHSEIAALTGGFYANTGCGSEVLIERSARFGFPPVFAGRRQVSWVNIVGGSEVNVEVVQARQDLPGGTRIERLVARHESGLEAVPMVVGRYPSGPFHPALPVLRPQPRTVRRVAAAAVGVAGALNLVSVFTPPLAGRLSGLLDLVPLVVPQAAAALVALAGLGLLFLATILLKGHRYAWSVAMALLAGSAVLHILKGADIEDALVAGGIALYVGRHQKFFRTPADRHSVRATARVLLIGSVIATLAGALAFELFPQDFVESRLPLRQALLGVAHRVAYMKSLIIPYRLDVALIGMVVAAGLGLAAYRLRERATAADGGKDE